MIDYAIQLGCYDIGFSGGDPLMREDFIDILAYCKNYPVHILTNGTLITDQFLNHLEEIGNPLIEFRISLDGISYHKKLRGINYSIVLSNIKKLLAREYIVSVNTMITNGNIHELMNLYSQLTCIGVDRWRLDFIFAAGNASRNSNVLFNPTPDRLQYIKILIERYLNELPDMEIDINRIFRSAALEGAIEQKFQSESFPCGYQKSLTVRPNGDVHSVHLRVRGSIRSKRCNMQIIRV